MKKWFLFVVITGVILSTKLAAQVLVPNGGFEQASPLSKTKTLHWTAESEDFLCIADSKTTFKGKYSLKLSGTTGGNHFFNEEFLFEIQGLKKYRIRCAFKTRGLKGRVQLGARVFDKDGGTITKTVFTLTEDIDKDWTMGEGVFVSDRAAAKLRVFGNLAGTGDAWFDEVSIEEFPQPTRYPSTEVMLYIHEFFDIVYENSIISDKNFLAHLKSKTMYLCADSIEKKDAQHILQYYTTPMLNDGHSFFTSAHDWKMMMAQGRHPSTGQTHHELPEGQMLKGNIAYINIPSFISSDEQLMQRYADSAHNIIARFDTQNVKGYIVDLGKNGGGNSLPMIAAIGPLIGDGICGYSFSGDGAVMARIYKDGAVGWDTSLTFRKVNPYKLKNTGRPIAVIYSGNTGSSGEVTATAFIGLRNARSFGQATSGATTRIDNFEMSDGSYLNLASGTNADRNKKAHDGPIKPDIETENAETAISEAINWILGYK